MLVFNSIVFVADNPESHEYRISLRSSLWVTTLSSDGTDIFVTMNHHLLPLFSSGVKNSRRRRNAHPSGGHEEVE